MIFLVFFSMKDWRKIWKNNDYWDVKHTEDKKKEEAEICKGEPFGN